MADSPEAGVDSRALRAVGGMVIITVVGLALSFALHNPSRREYPERRQVRFWHMWRGEWADVVQKIVDRFNESQDTYEVIALSVPGHAANSKFLLAVAGGDPPDCMAQWNNVIPKWADSELLVPLNSLMTEAEWTRFKETTYPIAKRIGIYKGNLYGVTTGLNVWACYYREDFLEEAGLDPAEFPETLEGLMEWGRKLHQFDAKGNIKMRRVLKLHPRLSPYKVAVLPLVKRDGMPELAREIVSQFFSEGINARYDEQHQIGKRYARHDEVGTPYCLTIDGDSIADGTVTIRDRDTTEQETIKIEEALGIVRRRLSES